MPLLRPEAFKTSIDHGAEGTGTGSKFRIFGIAVVILVVNIQNNAVDLAAQELDPLSGHIRYLLTEDLVNQELVLVLIHTVTIPVLVLSQFIGFTGLESTHLVRPPAGAGFNGGIVIGGPEFSALLRLLLAGFIQIFLHKRQA